MAATDLYNLCAELLSSCSAALISSPGGAIPRAYVSPGPPAWDCCPQLTVHAGGPQVGDTAPLQPPLQPGHRIEQTGMVNLVTLTVTVLRCAPVPTGDGQSVLLPNVYDMDLSAQYVLGDVWAIWNHLATSKRNGTLYPPDTREMFFDPAVALNTSGGCAGWQLQIRTVLGGYKT